MPACLTMNACIADRTIVVTAGKRVKTEGCRKVVKPSLDGALPASSCVTLLQLCHFYMRRIPASVCQKVLRAACGQSDNCCMKTVAPMDLQFEISTRCLLSFDAALCRYSMSATRWTALALTCFWIFMVMKSCPTTSSTAMR